MTWDEGLGLLLEFHRVNGHFDVPRPDASEATMDEGGTSKTSTSLRLYNWVNSLHTMYRSYKLGRQPGSLTNERITTLMEHGFEFASD